MTPRFNEQFYDGSVGAQFLAPERQTMSNQSSSPDIEPVAWRWIAKKGDVRWTFGAYAPSDAVKSEPLYTRASLQPATPTAGEAVTRESMRAAIEIAIDQVANLTPATGGDAVARCICQDECRKGYCTEQGCPNNIGGDAVAGDVQAARARKWDEGEHEGCGIDSQRALEREKAATSWQCHAKLRPEISECLWPDCGCEPRSTEIIAALVEQGWTPPNAAQPSRAAIIEECARAAEAEKETFLSPQYSSNQPFGSLCERFACDEVAKAIRALALPRPPLCTPSAEEK